MTTDPADLILDPTVGSGTTAFVEEHWGRRWITIDTSRIALDIAKTRLMTATFPYYDLYDQEAKDIRQGFIYKTVPHITLNSLANDEPAEQESGRFLYFSMDTYHFKNTTEKQEYNGFIAQDVMKLFPRLVMHNVNQERKLDVYTMDYSGLVL